MVKRATPVGAAAKTARAVPKTFGYMRVAAHNPYSDQFRTKLRAQKLDHFYEDVPAGGSDRPQFHAMIKELRPFDTVVMIRLEHLSTDPGVLLDLIVALVQTDADIKLVSDAALATPPTNALLKDLIHGHHMRFERMVHEGGDGGGGNGGP